MNKYELGNEFKENIERLPSLSLKQKVELLENLANEAGDNDIEIVKAIVRTKSVFDLFIRNNKDFKEKTKIKAEINRLQKFFNQDQILDLCELHLYSFYQFNPNQMIDINSNLKVADLKQKLSLLWKLSGEKIDRIAATYDERQGAPVFTVDGKYTSRGWTEWTHGFQFGSAVLQFDAIDESHFIDLAKNQILKKNNAKFR